MVMDNVDTDDIDLSDTEDTVSDKLPIWASTCEASAVCQPQIDGEGCHLPFHMWPGGRDNTLVVHMDIATSDSNVPVSLHTQRLVLHLHQSKPLPQDEDFLRVRIDAPLASHSDIVAIIHPTTYPGRRSAKASRWFANLITYFTSLAVFDECGGTPRIKLVGTERCSHRDLGLNENTDIVNDVRALLRTELEEAISYLPEDAEIRTMWAAMGYSTGLEALSAQVTLVTMDEFVRSAHPMEVEPMQRPSEYEEVVAWRRWQNKRPEPYSDSGGSPSIWEGIDPWAV
jgi:hypothetical protein